MSPARSLADLAELSEPLVAQAPTPTGFDSDFLLNEAVEILKVFCGVFDRPAKF